MNQFKSLVEDVLGYQVTIMIGVVVMKQKPLLIVKLSKSCRSQVGAEDSAKSLHVHGIGVQMNRRNSSG